MREKQAHTYTFGAGDMHNAGRERGEDTEQTQKQNGLAWLLYQANPLLFLWCRRGDLNSHGGTPTRP